jgi:hypothetical protein
MKEAIVFFLKMIVKYGIWIFGASWLLAAGSQVIYSRTERGGNSSDDAPENVKRKIILGALILIVGIIMALIPIQ